MNLTHRELACAWKLPATVMAVVLLAACGNGIGLGTNTYTIGVSVSGLLSGTTLALQDNGSDNITVSTNSTFNFKNTVSGGSAYSVTVLTQPAGETCTVISYANGLVTNANVNAAVTCIPNSAADSLIPVPGATGNTVTISLDGGPVPGNPQINIAYVAVTVCVPGTAGATAGCQTVDHVQLDTGSYGLRILNSALYSNLSLPAVTNPGGAAIGECTPFAVGTTWGSVALADIHIGGEVASSVPIQLIGGQPGGATAVPADCSNTGSIQITQALLGANGILGVGPFTYDCEACLSQAVPGAYYTCSATGCANSTITAVQVVQNPVAVFPQDNNGVLMELPAVSSAGMPALSGSLMFGIGTQPDNALGSATVYATDPNGYFSTQYYSTSMPYSFIDSGSNGLFFDDVTIPLCQINTWAYCPASSPLLLNATNSAASSGATGLVTFNIVGLDPLATSVVAANIGGPGISGSFDWGLPFFFGRSVYTAIAGASTPGGTGPYFAY